MKINFILLFISIGGVIIEGGSGWWFSLGLMIGLTIGDIALKIRIEA